MTVTSDPAKVVSSATTVTVTAHAFDTQCIPLTFYKLNGLPVSGTAYSTPLQISAEGDTRVEFQSRDLSMNWNAAQYVIVRIGHSIPHVTCDAAVRYVGSAAVHLSVAGDASDVALFQTKLDDEPTQTVSGTSATIATSALGQHRVAYFVRDNVGNEGSGASTFMVEDIVRSVTLTASAKELTYPAIVELVANASNPSTTTARFQRRRVDLSAWEDVLGGTVVSTTEQFVALDMPAYGYVYRAIVGSTQSNETTVAVHVPLSKPVASPARVKVGGTLRLSGTIRPKHGAATADILYGLYWQRYNAKLHRWANAGYTSTSIDPANNLNNDTSKWVYSLTTRSSMVGTYRVRFFHKCPRHKNSYSPWTTFTVYR